MGERSAKRYAYLSVYYSHTGQYVQAEDAIRRAIATHEQMAVDKTSTSYRNDLEWLYCHRGNNYLRWHRLPKAEASYRKCIELNPAEGTLYQNLGLVLNKMARYPEAEATLHRGIEINPNNSDVHNNLGGVYREQEKYELAAASFRRAIAIQPDTPTAHINLGPVLRKLGRYDESLATYRRVQELSSKLPAWYYPSARWLRDAERLAAVAPRLPALLSGEAQPADVSEQIAVARVYQDRKLNVASVRCYANAFAAAPPSADELDSYRFDAACAAALAGCGQGDDAAKLDDADRARLRRQALDWLTADLGGWTKLGENAAERPKVRDRVERWKDKRDLAGVREAAPLATVPEAERVVWQRFWADVDHLLTRVTGRPHGEEMLTLINAKLGPDFSDTLASMNNLAISYADLGLHAEALKLREETLALMKAEFGAEHPNTLGSTVNLARSYAAVGRHLEATKLYEDALPIMKAKIPNHDFTFNCVSLPETSSSF
jgi:tetratricopeptide (TPR) repeat protein